MISKTWTKHPSIFSVHKNRLGISVFVSSAVSVACWTGDISIGLDLVLWFLRHQEIDLIQISFGSSAVAQLDWKKR